MDFPILILTAVDKEREAVKKAVSEDPRFITDVCGFGPVQAAVKTGASIQKYRPKAVINAGIAGAYPGRGDIGGIFTASASVFDDLGAETAEERLSPETLGFGTSRWERSSFFNEYPFPAPSTEILTVSLATGTTASMESRMKRHPEAALEAMEGAGCAAACKHAGVPFMEVRSVSNMSGARSEQRWELDTALDVLTETFIRWKETLQ
ncbi:futalosine hydrolase [Alkalicoccus urumqiensis]|uniref:Futalosine hydrolase n=1 Tax=Alkalicoccus urumqiensis TaxID=1548213 RepID=A0A2P6MI91_ALKUR|nr:futalosine hydrolase [Alkalicoccus urumqiensis]PRO65978.1 futalosine hydrolase [Alkalicoccus urumqiensis]